MLPFNIVTSCLDFYQDKVSSIRGSFKEHSNTTFNLDARPVACVDLSLRGKFLDILCDYLLHGFPGQMDANRPLNYDLQWDLGGFTGADSSASQHRRRYRLLGYLFGACSPWLVLRSHPRSYVQRECKASGRLHRYLCDLHGSGRHLQ